MWSRIKALKVLLPTKVSWRKLVMLGCVLGLLVLSFCWGLLCGGSATAQTDGDPNSPLLSRFKAVNSVTNHRTVAYIYKNIPISREELGEFLIARFGPERLEFLVNHKIIEHACKANGIYVTDAEVEQQLVKDLKKMNIPSIEAFERTVLKKFNKTLYEYREDVVRPKLALAKFCRNKVTVTEEDIRKTFEAKYGPKVQCRMIVLPKEQQDRRKFEILDEIRNDDKAFDKYAKKQFVQALRAKGGLVPPIFKHYPNKEIERQAFLLEPGEVSTLIDMPDKTSVILKCVRKIPPVTTHRLEDEYQELHEQIFEAKLAAEIPKTFKMLREQAEPRIFLKRTSTARSTAMRINRMLTPESPSPLPKNLNTPLSNIKVPPAPPKGIGQIQK